MAKIFSERWEVITDLPEGGQAHVFKVVDKKGDGVTEYVLKRLKNPHRLDRFKKEYETLRNDSINLAAFAPVFAALRRGKRDLL